MNRPLAIAKDTSSPFVLPSVTSIRNFSYPLARRLYIQVVGGARVPNAAEEGWR